MAANKAPLAPPHNRPKPTPTTTSPISSSAACVSAATGLQAAHILTQQQQSVSLEQKVETSRNGSAGGAADKGAGDKGVGDSRSSGAGQEVELLEALAGDGAWYDAKVVCLLCRQMLGATSRLIVARGCRHHVAFMCC